MAAKNDRCDMCGAPAAVAPCARCPTDAGGHDVGEGLAKTGERPSGIFLEGKYRLLDEVGRGGMGTVFRAVDEKLERLVAVKFLLPELQQEPALVDRFRREARATASIRHRNVIQIYAYGRHGASDFFVAEYLEGDTADELVASASRRGEQLALADVLWILDQTCAGLQAVHEAGVVHRDVKPGNLMVDLGAQRVVIMDFGIGRRFLPGDVRGTAAPGGTPAYMPPEVISGERRDREQERRADIYALGVTAFELLTLRLPFASESWVDLLHQHMTEPPPAPSSLRPTIPRELDDIVLRCLAKDPAERFGSAAEVRAALEPLRRSRGSTEPGEPSRRLAPAGGAAPSGVGGARDAPTQSENGEPAIRVMVADPSPAFRARVHARARRTLPRSSFEATRTAADALDLARRRPPDVLVAPLRDAALNGIELAAMVRGDETLRRVTIVLVADRVTPEERELLERFGVRHVLQTPVTEQDLDAAIRAGADRAGAER